MDYVYDIVFLSLDSIERGSRLEGLDSFVDRKRNRRFATYLWPLLWYCLLGLPILFEHPFFQRLLRLGLAETWIEKMRSEIRGLLQDSGIAGQWQWHRFGTAALSRCPALHRFMKH